MAGVIIVSGPPCTGKTTIAKRLAVDLRLPFLYKDRIKESLFDSLGVGDPASGVGEALAWSQRLGAAAMDLLYVWVDAELAAGRSLLVESNFYAAQATQRFRALQARYPFATFQVQCRTAGAVLLARFQTRATAGTRHPGHLDALNYEHLAPVMQRGYSDGLDLGGEVIHLDTTDFARVDYGALLAAAQAFLARQPG